jgi:hypothetical protein
MPNLDVTNTEDFDDFSDYKSTIDYFDKNIDDDLKTRLDLERDRTYIGHGAYGIAYESGDTEQYNPTGRLVEKLTKEDEEVRNAEYLLANQIDSEDFPIARVFKVEKLKANANVPEEVTSKVKNEFKNEFKKDSGVSRIFLEYIEPVSKEFAVLYDHVDAGSMDFQSIEGNERAILLAAYGFLESGDLFSLNNEEYFDAFENLMSSGDEVVIFKKMFNVLNQMKDLESRLAKYGFSAEDVHGGNIGSKNGKLYIIDLGAFST